MTRRRVLTSALLFVPSLLLAAPAADLVVTGGRVWTGDPAKPWAEAVAIEGERIRFVGSAAEARALVGERTQVVELGGGLVVPGFNDAHVHFMGGAQALQQVDLFEAATLEAVSAQIRDFAKARPDAAWVVGFGWLYGAFPGGMPTKAQLDAVVPDRPAFMDCYDGHTGWANSKALAAAGITRDTPDPPGGEIVRDASGEPSGALKESAKALVERAIPSPSDDERYALVRRGLEHLSALGITSIQDAGYSPEEARRMAGLLARARAEGQLTVRAALSVGLEPGAWKHAVPAAVALRAEHDDAWLRVAAVKAYADGVIESRTAAMLAPYAGDVERGRPNWDEAELMAAVAAADAAGLQVYIHAIGDRGVRQALDAHENAARVGGPRDRRGRLEHIETLDPADRPRFAALGVIASMQPLHAYPNVNVREVWAKNVGPERASRAWGWRDLEQAGARVAFGSDWPVVTADVRRGLHCALTRTTTEGSPAGGWIPQQAVSLESALRHYTADAAFASFEENDKGTLAVGRLADIAVLDRDVFAEGAASLLEARVVLTIAGGRVVHDARGAAPAPQPTPR